MERVDVEQQSRTLEGPEAQRDVLSSWPHVRGDGRRRSAAAAQLIRFLEDVGDGHRGREAGRNLWKVGKFESQAGKGYMESLH